MDNYNTNETIWKDLIGYEGRYKIGSNGEIMNKRGLLLKQSLDIDGYQRITLYNGNKKTYRVHRLVVEHFIGSIPCDKEVNHIDYDRTNNHISNLEIVSHLENVRHSYDRIAKGNKNKIRSKPSKRRNVNKISDNKRNAKLTIKEVDEIRSKYSTGEYTQIELARMYGLKKSGISDLLNGKTWKNQGCF